MKLPTTHHVGNVILTFDRPLTDPGVCMFLILKEKKNKSDRRRKRKRVGAGKWSLPGGATEVFDRSQKHAAQRELYEESGDVWRMPLGDLRKVGLLKGMQCAKRNSVSWEDAQLKWIVHVYMTVIPQDLKDLHRLSKGIVDRRWFPLHSLPYDNMLTPDRTWMPPLFKGEQHLIEVLFDYQFEKMIETRLSPRRFS